MGLFIAGMEGFIESFSHEKATKIIAIISAVFSSLFIVESY
jgi:hypothetical protein